MTTDTIKPYRFIIWCAATAAFLCSFDGSVVAVSLPSMARSMGAGMDIATWVTAGYMVALSCALLPAGRLVDRFGPFVIFQWGFVGFALASAGCSASPGISALILMRWLQGLVAGMLVVAAFAIIPRTVPAPERAGAFALLTVLSSIGISLGAPLGGFLTEYASWRWIFAINIPVGLAAAILVKQHVAPDQIADTATSKELDPIATLAGAVALATALIALNRVGMWGWTNSKTLLLCGVSVFAGGWFSYRERIGTAPLIAWEAFSSPIIRRGFTLATIAYLYLAGFQLLFPFYLVEHRGFSTAQVGGSLLAYSLPLMAAGSLSARISRRFGLHRTQAAAMLLVSLGSLLLALGTAPLLLFPGMAGCGIGFGLFTSPNNAAVMSGAAPGEQGRVAGTFQTLIRVSVASGAVCFEALQRQASTTLQRFAHTAPDADELGFRTAFLAGALLCLLVAGFAVRRLHEKEVSHLDTHIKSEADQLEGAA